MTDWRQQLAAAIEAIEIHSPVQYSWFGKRSPALPPKVKRALRPQNARVYLSFQLRAQLYQDFYCAGAAVPESTAGSSASRFEATVFQQRLADANAGTGREERWEITAVAGGAVWLCRDGLTVQARRADCGLSPDEMPAVGSWTALRMPKQLPNLSPGFTTILSDAPPRGCVRHLLRLYWNLGPRGAIRLTQELTARLNGDGLAFRLKVLSDPSRYLRCDGVVLYLDRCDFDRVRPLLEVLHAQLCGDLSPRTPVFTLRLAAGLGLAEDPGDGRSFGWDRCGLMAEGVIEAWERSARSSAARLAVIEQSFARAGVELEAPFRSPGSAERYKFRASLAAGRRATSGPSSGGAPQRQSFLEAALAIGERLVRDALWHDRRCSWMGVAPIETVDGASRDAQARVALGPELYGGTSGIAVFLALLDRAVDGSARLRRTAVGALEQAIHRAPSLAGAGCWGLYTGRIGIAFAAARVGRLLRSDESLEHARALVRDVDVGAFDGEYDLLSGMAGAVVGLLVLRSLLDDRDPNDGPLDRAVRLGDRIVAAAQDRFGGASWPNAAASSRHNLTGLSHGAAGIGHALIELFHATGDVRFRRTAERTFEFERRWFDPAEMNWRDFRESPDRTPVDRAGIEPDAREDRAYALHWCHGAPGIALSRLRAHEILGDEIHAAEARTALDSTRRSLATAAADGRGNFSLCHGLAGNADVLLSASRRADLFGHDGRAGAHEVGQIGIARYGSGALPWPCGGVGETPALMLGLAGIGYFYLRLHDDTTPSLLMLRPD